MTSSPYADVIAALRHRQLNESRDGDVINDGGDAGEDELDSPTEQRLMRHLLRHYERAVRPVQRANDTVMVRMGLTLTQIFNMVSPRLVLFAEMIS